MPIQLTDIISVDVQPEDMDTVRFFMTRDDTFPYSVTTIRRNDDLGREIGTLGEMLVWRWLQNQKCPCEWRTLYKFTHREKAEFSTDLVSPEGHRVDVKTKIRSTPVRDYYEASIPNKVNPQTDVYVFCSYYTSPETGAGVLQLIGWQWSLKIPNNYTPIIQTNGYRPHIKCLQFLYLPHLEPMAQLPQALTQPFPIEVGSTPYREVSAEGG